MEAQLERMNIRDEGDEDETEVRARDLLIKLRSLLSRKHHGLRLPPHSDQILKRSLCHRKYNVDLAANQVHSFFKLFRGLNKIKDENVFRPSTLKSYYFDTFSMGFLKQKDANGAFISYVNYGTMPGENFSATKTLAVMVMLLHELCKESPDNQNVDVVVLFNLKGFGFAHAKQFGLSLLHTTSKIIQGSVPVSFKAIHCMNVPTIFMYTYALLKPFLRQKIKERMHLYVNDSTEFFNIYNKSTLPIALDGDLPNEEAVDTEFVERLCKKDDYYAELLQYGYEES